MPRPTRVTWCLTIGAYPDERCDLDHRPHDHHDVAVDYDSDPTGPGKVLYRLDPVGTTYLLPEGTTLRLTRYEDDEMLAEPLNDDLLPTYIWWSARGGASSGYDDSAIAALWDGPNLRPGVWRTVPVAPERAAVGSTYMRPNGEVWRVREWRRRIGDPADAPLVVTYVVMTPRGSMTNGSDLPDDARLVWAP